MIKNKINLLFLATIIFSSSAYSIDRDVRTMDELMSGLKEKVVSYCKDIKTSNEELNAIKDINREIRTTKNSPYEIGSNENNGVHSAFEKLIERKETPEECFSRESNILNNVFKKYYNKINDKEFIRCFNEVRKDDNSVAIFEDCIEDIKEKECQPLLDENRNEPYKRARIYTACLNS